MTACDAREAHAPPASGDDPAAVEVATVVVWRWFCAACGRYVESRERPAWLAS